MSPSERVGSKSTFSEMPEVMTPQQVQDLLQISSATFFRWIKAGQLPGAIKIGDSWRVMRDQLKAYLDQAVQTSSKHPPSKIRREDMTESSAQKISDALQRYMRENNIEFLKAPEAGEFLEQWGLLRDSKQRPGKPLRDLLRAGVIAGQEQPGGRNSTWYIRRVED